MNEVPQTEVKGVSIVTVTNRQEFIENVFSSYESQIWPEKELIIVLNNDSMNLLEWEEYAQKYNQVSIYQLPENVSLGNCLNFGVKKSKYSYIAKFDDDDYYGPLFLTEAMYTFDKMNADVVGKRTCYMYNALTKELRMRFPDREHKRASILQGGTIMAKKKVMEKVPFPDKNVGEGLSFTQRCRARGYRIYTTSRYNFAYIRHGDDSHTWNPSSKYFHKTSKQIAFLESFEDIVNNHQPE
ncbi:glycosyltransferase family 2 protein [Neobacillus mesonae]|uniref:glycosyltransferase family 2 protein n=1 Tax=Neobacillus mesonae TaxID=1193713 RepID=UPI00082E777F|nr:glycosyltransferase family 2 protein [Neobacillus mesonae]